MLRFPFIIIIMVSILVVQSSVSIGQQFEACEPKRCGKGPNISFPFWISNEHESYCGLPNFEITCTDDDDQILSIFKDDYIVRDIFYGNQSFLVGSNDGLDGSSCPIPLRNLSNIHPPFKFGQDHFDLYFFYNCTSFKSTDYPVYPIPCASSNTKTGPTSFFVYLYKGGFQYVNVTKDNCESMVSRPIDMHEEMMTYDAIAKMSYLDILSEGFVLEWNAPNCTECHTSGGHCGFQRNEFICFCRDKSHSNICSSSSSSSSSNTGSGRKSLLLLRAVAIVSGILVSVGAIVICCCIRRKSNISRILWKRKEKNSKNNVEDFFENGGLSTPRRYTYKEVKKMTNSFKEKIGQGGYGSVFKGKLPSGRMVAVKVLSETKGNGDEFINEVVCISRTSHVNIVSLLGFCVEGLKRALIYEFMPNGSLEKFINQATPLRENSHLGWEALHKIGIGIARGLEYLHRRCNTQILHFDIKPNNILLDHDFTPKIADFGMSKLCRVDQSIISMTGARGTPGYIAPEFISRNFGRVSHKSDVYSYGMMVLEMVGGRKNPKARAGNSSEIYFPDWLYKHLDLNEDLGLNGVTSSEDQEISQKMVLVGLWCIQIDPHNRPPMSRVLDMLQGSLEALQIPPKPFLFSPPREEAYPSREEEGSSFSVLTL